MSAGGAGAAVVAAGDGAEHPACFLVSLFSNFTLASTAGGVRGGTYRQ